VIENQLNFEIEYMQENGRTGRLARDQKAPFAWEFPMQERVLLLRQSGTKEKHLRVSLDKMNQRIQHEYKNWVVKTVLEHATRKVLVSHTQVEIEKTKEEEYHSVINIHFASLGISLVQNFNEAHAREILFVTLQGLQFMLAQSAKTRDYQLRLKYLNVDNNAKLITPYPVLFTPKNRRALKENESSYFLNVLLK